MAKYSTKQKSILQGSGHGPRSVLKGTDWITILLCLISSGYGLLLVHSATRSEALLNEKLVANEVITTVLGITLGLMAALALSFVDYELLLRFWYVFAAVTVILMLLLLTPLGQERGRAGATRWFELPGGITFQPSELLKMGFIISFTWHLHRVREHINQIKTILLLGVHALIPFGLVAITGDLGSAIVFLCITAGMLFLAGLKLRWFGVIGAMGVAALPLIWTQFVDEFQKARVYAIYLPDLLSDAELKDKIFQQQQAMIAIGSGGLFGKGLFNGTVHVPVQESDMIFSKAGEEFGFLGCLAVLALIALMIGRLILVSSHTRNFRARLMCAGVAFMIGSQAIINIGVCIKLLPVTGITLPFFSSGGSSNLCLYIAIGLALTVYRHQNEHEDTQSYFDYLYS